jgi:tRNA-Thr(GGU) m(6)t(6)A37 methyltransferase TsaA
MSDEFTFKPIAFFQTSKTQNLEASSQGTMDPSARGSIDLKHWPEWPAMLANLEGFSHLWLIFVFHQNSGNWKPKVLPPRADHKVGVFASRSPYRPSPIGISAVKIEKIVASCIEVSGHDLVAGTPILDIKPYLPYADSFPEAEIGWVAQTKDYELDWTERARQQIHFLRDLGLSELEAVLRQQLRFNPTDKQRKRVRPAAETTAETTTARTADQWIFSYRTWRIRFSVQEQRVQILDLNSGYGTEELLAEADPYHDKALHRQFRAMFPD